MWTCDMWTSDVLDMSYLEIWTCHLDMMIMCRVNDLSGLCYVRMLIHFRSGEFQALDMSTF